MSLQDQIQQMTNSAEFARLVNMLFAAEYGPDYQVVDGTRGDDGNDGYLRSEERILAIYCPSKPERRTDRDYLQKGISDLQKAGALRDAGTFAIRKWTFVTPRALKNSVLTDLMRAAEPLQLEANHLEGCSLAEMLLRHRHLLPEFPELHVSQLEELLARVLAERDAIAQPVKAGAPDDFDEIDDIIHIREESAVAEGLKEVVQLRKSDDLPGARVRLRALCLGSADPHVQLNALFGLFDFYSPAQDSNEDLANLAESCIPAARRIKSLAAEAYILANRGYYLAAEVNGLAVKNFFSRTMDYLIGLPPDTSLSQRISAINQRANQALTSGLEMAMQLRSPKTLAAVLLQTGSALGQRALMQKSVGDTETARGALAACRMCLMNAKNIYAEIGDEHGVANVTLNLINQVRFFGDTESLKLMLPEVVRVAEKYHDDRLLRKATMLRERLETGRIPDCEIPPSWTE